MGFFTDVVEGFARSVNGHGGRIDQLCAQLQWSVDEREGDTVTLNFKCPVIGTRPVYITSGDEPLVLFWTASMAIFDSRSVPDYVIGYALFANSKTALGKWQAAFDKRDQVIFSIGYTALGRGLDAAALKYICTKMAGEASEFDAKMQEKGYLR